MKSKECGQKKYEFDEDVDVQVFLKQEGFFDSRLVVVESVDIYFFFLIYISMRSGENSLKLIVLEDVVSED